MLLPFCFSVNAGFVSSAVGGAVGGYVGSNVGSKHGNKIIVQSTVQQQLEENTIILKLTDYGTTFYDFSCGKVCIMTKGSGCEGNKFKWMTVEKYLKQTHPTMKSYSMSTINEDRYSSSIVLKVKLESIKK